MCRHREAVRRSEEAVAAAGDGGGGVEVLSVVKPSLNTFFEYLVCSICQLKLLMVVGHTCGCPSAGLMRGNVQRIYLEHMVGGNTQVENEYRTFFKYSSYYFFMWIR